MKNNILFILLVLLITAFNSCDDSFLDKNNKPIDGTELQEAITIPFETGYNQINIQLSEFEDDMSYSVVVFPKSIGFNSLKGKINNKTLSLPYYFYGVPWSQLGVPVDVGSIIIDIKDFGYFKIDVNTIYYGESLIVVDKEELDFGESTMSLKLRITNKATGLLKYNIHNIPEWIDIKEEQKKGLLYNYESIDIDVNCNRNHLEQGDYEGVIEILNEVTNEIKTVHVKMAVSVYKNIDIYPPVNAWHLEILDTTK